MQIFKHLTANAINLTPFDFHRELSMEAYLIENEAVLALDDKGFDEVIVLEDELSILLTRKPKPSDGRIDLVVYYSTSNTLAVIELKKGVISSCDIKQLTDYLEEWVQILQEINKTNPEIKDPNWIGILAGSSISSDLIADIASSKILNIKGAAIPISALTIKRYRSDDGQVFIATDTYLNPISASKKNYTKYSFNGNDYGKGRLVLAVLTEHAKNNPTLNYENFKADFPDHIRGNASVFTLSGNVKPGCIRHFIKPNEIIKLSNARIAVSNQWGADFDKPLKVFRDRGYDITSK